MQRSRAIFDVRSKSGAHLLTLPYIVCRFGLIALLLCMMAFSGVASAQRDERNTPVSTVKAKPSRKESVGPPPKTPQVVEKNKTESSDASELQEAILALVLNGQGRQDIQVFLGGNDAWIAAGRLEEEGIAKVLGNRKTIKEKEYVSLASLAPDLLFELDLVDLKLRIFTQKLNGGPQVIDLKDYSRPANIAYGKDTSAFLNYSLQSYNFHLSSFEELGFSWKRSLAYTTLSIRDDGHFVRGMSNITIDDPKRMLRVVLGDSATSNGLLGSNLIVGGIRVSRQFSLDPYFVRFPSFGMAGNAAAPSTVDVYVNGRLVSSTQVDPGAFDVQNIPAVLGAGNAQVVVRDVFGRQQQVASPFYYSTGVLKSGLDEYNFVLGARRNNLNTQSFNYGEPAFYGNYRLGFTDYVTAGVRGEFSQSLANGGPNVTFRMPLGEIELTGSGSYGDGKTGYAAALGYSFISKVFSAGALARLQSDAYTTLSLDAAFNRSTVEANVYGAIPITNRANATLQYTVARYRDGQKRDRLGVLGRIQLNQRINLLATAGVTRIDSQQSFEGLLSLTFYFGDRTTGSFTHVQSGAKPNELLQVQRPLALDPGFGYRVDVQHGETTRGLVLGQYQTEFGIYEASVERIGSETNTRFSAAGGVVYIGGDVFLTRPLYESFGLIQVPNTKGVRGYLNNQPIGNTSASGNLLVPNLISYYGNRLSINDRDVPLTQKLNQTEFVLAPPFRGGVVARFDARLMQAVTGKVIMIKGDENIVPTYGEMTVTVEGKEVSSPLGEHGEFYLEDLASGRSYQARVVHEDVQCDFPMRVISEDKGRPVVDMGVLKCVLPAKGPQK